MDKNAKFFPGSIVFFGDELLPATEASHGYKPRRQADTALDFLRGRYGDGHIAALYGCRHTGKTTIMHHAIQRMSDAERNRTALITCLGNADIDMLLGNLQILMNIGIRWFFIDEATKIRSFGVNAGAFDCGCFESAKFVFAGTNSLLFWLNFQQSWLGRGFLIPTSYISFGEMEEVHGEENMSLARFLHNGGTMKKNCFSHGENLETYVFSSIAGNIESSLANAEDIMGSEQVFALAKTGCLYRMVNCLVKKAGHNLIKENISDLICEDFFPNNIKAFISFFNSLSIMKITDKEGKTIEQLFNIAKKNIALRLVGEEAHADRQSLKHALNSVFPNFRVEAQKQLMDCMETIGFIQPICVKTFSLADGRSVPMPDSRKTWFLTQPGIRWRQASAVLEEAFKLYSFNDRKQEVEKINSVILGEILEESLHLDILYASRMLDRPYEVFMVKFIPEAAFGIRHEYGDKKLPAGAAGEIDIVVQDSMSKEAVLIECKHGRKHSSEASKNIADWRMNEILKKNGIFPVARFVAANVDASSAAGEPYWKDGHVPAYAYEFCGVQELMRTAWKDPKTLFRTLWQAAGRQRKATKIMLAQNPALADEVRRLEEERNALTGVPAPDAGEEDGEAPSPA